MVLSPRALSILGYIADSGEVPFHVLLQAFWGEPANGRAEKSMQEWVRRQRHAGWLRTSVPRGENTTVRLSPKAKAILGERNGAPAFAVGHPRARAHHAATLLYIEQVRSQLGPNEAIVESLLEPQLRAREQAGRGTRRGQVYDSFPDAMLRIEEMTPDGVTHVRNVAVEYVTSKYTSKDILEKSASFASKYEQVLWVADNPRTQARVERLVGGECACLQ